MDKIEFYKNRNLGERFSASAEFIRQNWKVMYQIVLIPAIPLALLQGYFQQGFVSGYLSNLSKVFSGGGITEMNNIYSSGGMWMYLLMALLFSLVVSAISGAVMSRYEDGLLSNETNLNDLSGKIFSNMGKLFLIGLAMTLITIVAVIIFVLMLIVIFKISKILSFLIAFAVVIAVIPPFYLIRFPAIFQGESTLASIGKGYKLGFKNWGTTFLMVLILGIVGYVISLILSIPNSIWTITHIGSSPGGVSYILSALSSLGTAFVTPLVFVFMAFQYFSVAEKAEGISLQAKIKEFDNL